MEPKRGAIKRRYSIVDNATQAILELISSRNLKIGDELPSQSALEVELGVGRNSVREACQRLVMLGIIEMRAGRKMAVGASLSRIEAIPDARMWESILQERAFADILELRFLLEPEVAALATRRITESQIEQLQAILFSLRAAKSEQQAWRLSFSFHRGLASYSGNRAAAEFLLWVENKTAEVYPTIYQRWRETNSRDLDFGEHQAIYSAVKERNPDKARLLMRKHIHKAYVDFLNDRLPDSSNVAQDPALTEG